MDPGEPGVGTHWTFPCIRSRRGTPSWVQCGLGRPWEGIVVWDTDERVLFLFPEACCHHDNRQRNDDQTKNATEGVFIAGMRRGALCVSVLGTTVPSFIHFIHQGGDQ